MVRPKIIIDKTVANQKARLSLANENGLGLPLITTNKSTRSVRDHVQFSINEMPKKLASRLIHADSLKVDGLSNTSGYDNLPSLSRLKVRSTRASAKKQSQNDLSVSNIDT